jgi:hypothetical protein
MNLIDIEKTILNTYKTINNLNKNICFGLSNQLYSGMFKIYRETVNFDKSKDSCNTVEHTSSKPKHLFLKISGIWENESDIGITYKVLND